MQTPLTEMELYAIARVIGGQPWQMLTVSPLVGTMLGNLNVADIGTLLRMLGTEVTGQILKIDPYTMPPEPQQAVSPLRDVYVPPLPAEAQLSDTALKAAEGVAGWLDDALAWAVQRSPMTPRAKA
jgi:hypothetical protein